jgi:hypothetical protein
VGPRAGLDAVKKRKIFASAGIRNPAVQPVARRYPGFWLSSWSPQIQRIPFVLDATARNGHNLVSARRVGQYFRVV